MTCDWYRRLALFGFAAVASAALVGAGPVPTPSGVPLPSGVPSPSKAPSPRPNLLPTIAESIAAAKDDTITELILDASGSMKAKVQSRTKLFQAKRVLKAFLVQARNDRLNIGLRVYGMKQSDCKDTKLVLPFEQRGYQDIEYAMESIDPKGYGKTPLALSLEKAAEDLKKHGQGKKKRIVVVSDGVDTCQGDPCKVAQKLKRELDVQIFVIGYSIDDNDRQKLKCMADATGGSYSSAGDLSSLFSPLKNLASSKDKNLIVKSPDLAGMSRLFEVLPSGKKIQVAEFVSNMGIRVEPGKHYEVVVGLEPPFRFPDIVLKPGEKRTLVVKGDGQVFVEFMDGLFDVAVLDEHGKVVTRFASDAPAPVPAGFYKLKVTAPPFAEKLIDDVVVAPKGLRKEAIDGFGAIQLDEVPALGLEPGPFGYYIFDETKKLDLGSFLTGVPVILPFSKYILKTHGDGLVREVYPDRDQVTYVPMPPPGKSVIFSTAKKPAPAPKPSAAPGP